MGQAPVRQAAVAKTPLREGVSLRPAAVRQAAAMAQAPTRQAAVAQTPLHEGVSLRPAAVRQTSAIAQVPTRQAAVAQAPLQERVRYLTLPTSAVTTTEAVDPVQHASFAGRPRT